MNRDDEAPPPPPPPMPPQQVTAPPAHCLLTLTQAADVVSPSPMAPDSSDKPPRRLALPTQLPPRWAAIIASHGEDADTSWADAMREEWVARLVRSFLPTEASLPDTLVDDLLALFCSNHGLCYWCALPLRLSYFDDAARKLWERYAGAFKESGGVYSSAS